MALSPNVVVVNPGELITSTHLNNIRANLDRIDVLVGTRQSQGGPFSGVVAGATTDATTTTSYVTWMTIPSVGTVPSWATQVIIQVNVSNVQAVTADCIYSLTATMNGGSYGGVDHGAIGFLAAGNLTSTSFVLTAAATGLGGPSVLIGARRVAGTGTLRANTSSRISAAVWFR
jgi:hypothetical protein